MTLASLFFLIVLITFLKKNFIFHKLQRIVKITKGKKGGKIRSDEKIDKMCKLDSDLITQNAQIMLTTISMVMLVDNFHQQSALWQQWFELMLLTWGGAGLFENTGLFQKTTAFVYGFCYLSNRLNND